MLRPEDSPAKIISTYKDLNGGSLIMPHKKLSTPAEILAVALKKEQNAFTFYDKVSKATNVDFIKELCDQLREEEAKHIKMIRKKITQHNIGR